MSEETTATPETTPSLVPVHLGFGKYEVDGQKFKSKAAAEKYLADKAEEAVFANDFGDVWPEGYDITVRTNEYHYRGSLMDLAMNELYAPDGSHNPFYDRQWMWGWASHTGTDIADKQSLGYKLVTLDELERGIKDGRIPPHVAGMVRSEGSYLVYGDNVLMRMPRVLWRQRRAAKFQASLARVKKQDDESRRFFENAGVGIGKESGTNELNIRM